MVKTVGVVGVDPGSRQMGIWSLTVSKEGVKTWSADQIKLGKSTSWGKQLAI